MSMDSDLYVALCANATIVEEEAALWRSSDAANVRELCARIAVVLPNASNAARFSAVAVQGTSSVQYVVNTFAWIAYA